MKLNDTEKNALKAVEHLLSEINARVSSKGLKEEMVLHPDFPSVASISDALTEWQIPNMAVRLPAHQLKEIPLPSLAYVNVRGGILAPLKSINQDIVEWFDTENGWQKDTLSQFEAKWDGLTLLLEPNERSGEEHYSKRIVEQYFSKARAPFLILGTVICLGIIFVLNWNSISPNVFSVNLLIGVKLLGMIVSGLILLQSLDTHNPFLQNICQLSNKSNCNSILQSKASRITEWLSWSDVGFVYFSGGFLYLTIALVSGNNVLVSNLYLLSLAAVPYTVYSVWYQRFVARQWCLLCMSIQCLIWVEFVIVLVHFNELNLVWNGVSIGLLVVSFLIPILIWVLVKKPLTESTQLFEVQRQLQKVKFDENYVRATFRVQTKMPPIFDGMHSPTIGNTEALHTLTVVTNPLCGPCSKLHREIDQFIETNTNFNCQFIFLGPPKAWIIAYFFLSTTIDDRRKLMETWYSNIQQNAQSWINSQKKDVDYDYTNEQIVMHSTWCELAGVAGTPTVYVDGIKLPQAFNIRDLKRISQYLSTPIKNSIAM